MNLFKTPIFAATILLAQDEHDRLEGECFRKDQPVTLGDVLRSFGDLAKIKAKRK